MPSSCHLLLVTSLTNYNGIAEQVGANGIAEQVGATKGIMKGNLTAKDMYCTTLMTTIKSTSNSTIGTTDRWTKSRKKC